MGILWSIQDIKITNPLVKIFLLYLLSLSLNFIFIPSLTEFAETPTKIITIVPFPSKNQRKKGWEKRKKGSSKDQIRAALFYFLLVLKFCESKCMHDRFEYKDRDFKFIGVHRIVTSFVIEEIMGLPFLCSFMFLRWWYCDGKLLVTIF